MGFMSLCKAIRTISFFLETRKPTEWRPKIVVYFTKKTNILIFPYSFVILRCTVFENIYKLQVRAFVYHTLFGQDAGPRAGPRPGRPEEEVAEPVAGVAAGTEKQYADAVQYCTGEGPLRTGPNVRAETNANEKPVSRSTLVGLVSVCYYVMK